MQANRSVILVTIIASIGLLAVVFTAVTGWHIPDLFRGEITVTESTCPQTGQQFRFTQAAGGDIGYSWTLWRRPNEKNEWIVLTGLAADSPKVGNGEVALQYEAATDSLIYRMTRDGTSSEFYFIFDGTQTQALQEILIVILSTKCSTTGQEFMVARSYQQMYGDQTHNIWYRSGAGKRWSKLTAMNLVYAGPAPSISYDRSGDILNFTMGGVAHQLQLDGTRTGRLAKNTADQ